MEDKPKEEFFAGISPEVFATLKLGDEVIVKRSDGTWDTGWKVVAPEDKGRLVVMKGNDKKSVGPEHLQAVSKMEAGAGDSARTQVFNQEDVNRALFQPNDEVILKTGGAEDSKESYGWKVMGIVSEGKDIGKIMIVKEDGTNSQVVEAGQLEKSEVVDMGPEIRRMDDPRFVKFVSEQISMENLKRALASNENGVITFGGAKYDLKKMLRSVEDIETRAYDPDAKEDIISGLLEPDLLAGFLNAPLEIANTVSKLLKNKRAAGGQKRAAM